MRASRHGAVLLALALAGCSADFQPRSFVADLRVLAIVGLDPDTGGPRLDLAPGERITLQPHRVAPPGVSPGALTERWTFCPFSLGARAGYACAVPQCEVALPAPASSDDAELGVPVTADVTALLESCLAQLQAGSGSLPAGVPSTLPDQFDVLFRYVVTSPAPADTPDGSTREAVQRVTYYPKGAPSPRNLPPGITCATVGGIRAAGTPGCAPDGPLPALAHGGRLPIRVVFAPDAAQTYVDTSGATVQETLVVSYYTTAGRFEDDRANGPDGTSVLKGDLIPAGVTEARVWAVASDLRGGEVVLGPWRFAISGP